jgi:hypothetical protein
MENHGKFFKILFCLAKMPMVNRYQVRHPAIYNPTVDGWEILHRWFIPLFIATIQGGAGFPNHPQECSENGSTLSKDHKKQLAGSLGTISHVRLGSPIVWVARS